MGSNETRALLTWIFLCWFAVIHEFAALLQDRHVDFVQRTDTRQVDFVAVSGLSCRLNEMFHTVH